MLAMWRITSEVMPVSSSTSRTAACEGVSSPSRWPLGRHHSRRPARFRRAMIATYARPPSTLITTPPALVSSTVPVVEETSAGGVVIKVEGGRAYVAIIARRNRAGRLEWCLPKGHLEGEETPSQAAVREVEEETGITSEVIRHIASIDYWFSGTNRRVHKVVHHYLLHFLQGEITVENDPDQEAEEAAWKIGRASCRERG